MQAGKFIVTADGSHSMLTEDGSISYHSRHGAIQESNHVFIDAALRHKAQQQKHLKILEIGFGTGLNVFLTYLEAVSSALKIELTTYELYPLSVDQAAELNFTKVLNCPELQDLFLSLHASTWEESNLIAPDFSLTKVKKSFLKIDQQNEFDIVFFDPFAPNDQPEFWSKTFLQKIYDAMNPSGVLTTYCAKGVVKRTLKEIGFLTEGLPGPPGKREMTRATVPPKK